MKRKITRTYHPDTIEAFKRAKDALDLYLSFPYPEDGAQLTEDQSRGLARLKKAYDEEVMGLLFSVKADLREKQS